MLHSFTNGVACSFLIENSFWHSLPQIKISINVERNAYHVSNLSGLRVLQFAAPLQLLNNCSVLSEIKG
jgi:predicted DNA-binding ribbon-helix-helix protein